MSSVRLALIVAFAALLTACNGTRQSPSESVPAPRPLLVQGAMDVEVRALVNLLEHPLESRVQGWTFWTGTLNGYPVVISKTMKGGSNTAAATAIAIERFHPIAIINQGTAGGHDPALHVADIVLGAESMNIGSFKTGSRARGAGTDFAEWKPMDLLFSEGSAGQTPEAWTMRRFKADPGLLEAANGSRTQYTRGRVVAGVIGSSDIWNSELDRIARFHDEFGTSAEEMETAPAAQVAAFSQVPFLGIRILSNNITNGDAYNGQTAELCQTFVAQVARTYIATHVQGAH
ncbi:MAG: 5'-methylthioadenosine/S-adenosylhomocysteine nucleosidase [Vicinamibacterales bacterium]